MIEVTETSTCEISPAPASIPHNLPVILRANPAPSPRYTVTSSGKMWQITDHDAYDKDGNPIVISRYRPKSEWTVDDVRSFAKLLNRIQ